MNKGRFPNIGRVVYRSNNNANANGGVAYANANNDTANVNANIGSRLAHNTKSVMPQRYSGVQHRGRVLTVVPMGKSLSNSISFMLVESWNITRWGGEIGRGGVCRQPKMLSPEKLKAKIY